MLQNRKIRLDSLQIYLEAVKNILLSRHAYGR
jgi:hypothetical protein